MNARLLEAEMIALAAKNRGLAVDVEKGRKAPAEAAASLARDVARLSDSVAAIARDRRRGAEPPLGVLN